VLAVMAVANLAKHRLADDCQHQRVRLEPLCPSMGERGPGARNGIGHVLVSSAGVELKLQCGMVDLSHDYLVHPSL
jgi:hypothetical protein